MKRACKTPMALSAALIALIAAPAVAGAPQVHPDKWPASHSPVGLDKATEAKITAILKRMSLEEKVGQVIQPEIRYITPEEVAQYHIGTIENGGGSWPQQNKHATVADWVKLSETYYQAALKGNRQGVPLLWATDAVHGDNNVFGATLYPHNIGLGAMHDPALMEKIGAATAREVRATGLDWAFAPTIAVARDDRWGRTYESYSEDPKIVTDYAAAMVKGLEGSGPAFLDQDHVIATAKHFLGDGSTDGGRDQGDSLASEDDLIRLHAQGYAAAVDAGVQSVMASYNSWHGVKMHANKALLTDVLKGRMGFDGMIMGDWNAHGQIPGCTNGDCPITFNAGLDVFNAPTDWKALYGHMIAEVKAGTIPQSRLDDAVRRILRVKFRAHLFDEPSPANRPGAGGAIGTPEHRAIARQAVAESLVLLKNDAKNGKPILPLKPSARILIAGDGADNLAMQSGGWTSSWQGTDNTNADFPGATSIYQGLKAQIEAAGGQALYSPDGVTPTKPDAAIVVFGETPYAEFMGDQPDVALHHDNAESLALLKKLKAEGVPVVAVLLSGRPLYVNPQINAADAFVAAWLPGSEGEGVADVLLGRKDFTGKLAFSWPKRPDQTPLNVGDADYDPQFAYGYGLSYAHPADTPQLPEVAETTKYGEKNVYFTKGPNGGDVWNGYKVSIGDSNAPHMDYVGTRTTLYGTAALTVAPQDDGALHAVWNGKSDAWLEIGAAAPSDIAREANGAMRLAVTLRVNAAPSGAVKMGVGAASLPITAPLQAAGAGYARIAVPLSCFKGQDLSKTPTVLRLETAGTLDVSISDVRLTEAQGDGACPAD